MLMRLDSRTSARRPVRKLTGRDTISSTLCKGHTKRDSLARKQMKLQKMKRKKRSHQRSKNKKVTVDPISSTEMRRSAGKPCRRQA